MAAIDKVALALQVREKVQVYIKLMRDNGLSSLMVSMGVALNDESSVFMGKLNDELDLEGYEVQSHSTSLFGRSPEGVPLYTLSLWIVTKGGVANRKALLTPGQSSLR